MENVLAYDIGTFLRGNAYLTAKHLTLHQCSEFVSAEEPVTSVLNNCILADISEPGNTEPTLNSTYSGSSSGIFQTVGAAAHYLANGSVYRDAGNAGLNSSALNNDLKTRTTYPPIVLGTGTYYTNSLTLSPQAQRDINTPDRGYHYDPIDYVLNGVPLTNAVITAGTGTALAVGVDSGTYGLYVLAGASFVSEGSPTNLNRIVRYNTVQEQANTSWTARADSVITSMATASAATVRCRYVEWVVPAQDVMHFYGFANADTTLELRDCQLFGGEITSLRPKVSATNSLLHRVCMLLDDDFGSYTSGHTFQNNLYYGGSLTLTHDAADAWTFSDNFFVGTTNANFSGVAIAADYNAYTTNVTRLYTSATHDVLLATNVIAFDIGALGRFYLPTNGAATNLLNRGSTTADLVGLYHYTTSTNQVKETTTTNDIGFHYVALNGTTVGAVPLDADGDGIPDFGEDANGNGTLDHLETKTNDASDPGLRVYITRPRSGSAMP